MNEIKDIIDDLAIAALEANTKIASVAVVSDSGELIYQTENWDLSSSTDSILKILKGDRSILLNGIKFLVSDANAEGIIGTNEGGMGHIIFAPFQGGVLVSYVMPGADPHRALSILKKFALRLNGKVQ
ncbi:MAG: hypothetical protein ACFFBE_14970 [Promethearchaeota archaeon]